MQLFLILANENKMCTFINMIRMLKNTKKEAKYE